MDREQTDAGPVIRKDKLSGAKGGNAKGNREKIEFIVPLTTSKNANYTRLVHTLFLIMRMDTDVNDTLGPFNLSGIGECRCLFL